MDAGTLVLLHSPLAGVQSWGSLPEALRRGGVGAVAVAGDTDDRPPFAERYVRGAGARGPGAAAGGGRVAGRALRLPAAVGRLRPLAGSGRGQGLAHRLARRGPLPPAG